MKIADRIQHLRKIMGISQEELAERVGVSRQAVSKWESEQSIPEIDKIIILSELFDVTTDYLLKGIEPAVQEKSSGFNRDARIFVIAATALHFIGLAIASAVWYEYQTPVAIVIGLIFMVNGCMVYGIGMINSLPATKPHAKRTFWSINIWLLSFIPLSFVYNVLFAATAAPYPMYGNPRIALPIFWLIYIGICSYVVWVQTRRDQ